MINCLIKSLVPYFYKLNNKYSFEFDRIFDNKKYMLILYQLLQLLFTPQQLPITKFTNFIKKNQITLSEKECVVWHSDPYQILYDIVLIE